MSKIEYDNFRVIIKERGDNTLVVFVDYYKDGKFIEQKRTTNSAFIEKILKTATSTVKDAKFVGNNLEANYQANSSIIIENYNFVKERNEFVNFNKKVSKKIKKEKQSEKQSKESVNKKEILKGVKNLKVSRNKKFFEKIKLSKKFVSIATLSLVVMTQIVPLVRNLQTLSLFPKGNVTTESNSDLQADSMSVYADQLFTQVEKNQTVDVQQLVKSIDQNSDTAVSLTNTEIDINNSIQQDEISIVVPEIIPEVNQDINIIPEQVNDDSVNVTNELNTEEVIAQTPTILSEDSNNDIVIGQEDILIDQSTSEIEEPSPVVELELESNTNFNQNEDLNKEKEVINSQIETVTVEPSIIPSDDTIQELSVDSLVTTTPEATVTPAVETTDGQAVINEKIESDTKNDDSTNSLYTTDQLNKVISESMAKYNLTTEQYDKICAVVQQEAGHNPEEVMNVMTTIVNRMNSGEWCGSTPWEVITASGQFQAYGAGHYKKYQNHNYDESTAYIVGAMLTGEMEPTHNWERFNSNGSTNYGGTILTSGGNRYK